MSSGSNLFKEYISVGQSIGLSGDDLINFAKDQVNTERENRLLERNAAQKLAETQALNLKATEALEIQKAEIAAAASREQAIAAQKLAETQALFAREQAEAQIAAAQKQMQAEMDKIKMLHELELAKLCHEKEYNLRQSQMENETKLKCAEINSATQAVSASTSITNSMSFPYVRQYNLGIELFDNVAENLDSHINRFYVVAKAYSLPNELYCIELVKTLHGPSLQVFEMMDTESKTDFDALVQALRKRFRITEGSYRKQFKTSRPQKNESLTDFVWRLRHYLKMWLQKSIYTQDYEGLFDLMVSQAFYQSLDKNTQVFLREHGKLNLDDMVKLAENYTEAHMNYDRVNQNNPKKEFNGKFAKTADNRDSLKSENGRTVNETRSSESKRDSYKKDIVCFKCSAVGHKSFQCPNKQNSVKRNETPTVHKAALCQIRNDNVNDDTTDIFPMISSVMQKEETVQDLKFPLKGIAIVNKYHHLSYLRDTGATYCIIDSQYVSHDCLSGETVAVLLADRSVRHLKEGKIHLKCPGFTGVVKVLLMDHVVVPLIIGNNIFESIAETDVDDTNTFDSHEINIPVFKTVIFENSAFTANKCAVMNEEQTESMSKVPEKPHGDSVSMHIAGTEHTVHPADSIISAVQTRNQVRAEQRAIKPLKHTIIDALNLNHCEFSKLQKEDSTLSKYWKMAEENLDDDVHKVYFMVKNDILYRVYKPGPHEDNIMQVMVPKCLQEKVVLFAHETTLSAHMGINSTYRKLCSNFYFAGAMNVCKRMVLSCIKCQQGANRSVGGKAPLMNLPIITQPFHSAYVDLIGKIDPPSAENHTHILCVMDSATHFVMATPLKRTDSVSIAENLMKQFDLVGYPQNLYCDNASNLTSDIIREIYRTMGINMKTIAVYNPQSNLIERQNGTIKAILRKLVENEPRQWHRYLDALMFALRTTPNASGFSPFELMFGRQARTHLSVLKELWTEQNSDPETKTTYQYILDLQNRIADTCEFAQKELAKVRERNHRRFNAKSKLRTFKPQDRVWVLCSRTQGKFDFNWVGPATVLERRGHVTYKIQFDNGNVRLFHINMLKAFISRETVQTIKSTDLTDTTSAVQPPLSDEPYSIDNVGISAAVMGMVQDSDVEDDEYSSSTTIRLGEGDQCIDIASAEQTETWKDVKINPLLSKHEQEKLWTLVQEYKDIFSDVPTITNLVTYDIKLKSDEVIHHKPYKIPVHLVDKVEQELQKMLRLGWIERNENPEYASPLVIVKKRDSDDLRLCVSYKSLNSQTVLDYTPQPDIEDILAKLGKSRFFSVCDASKGFYSIPMEESAKKYTSFVTPRDCFVFNVCPFGLANAPSCYARLTRKLLQGLSHVDNFVDDIITFTDDLDQHIIVLRSLFERVRNANIRLKPSKVRLGFNEVSFTGQIVGNGTVRPTQENIDKVLNAPIPRTKKGVRSLCGMVNWLRKYISHAAKLLKPLNELTSKHHSDTITWGKEQQDAWEEIKRVLTSEPVLSLYDATKEHVIMTDASETMIGGVLLQRENDGLLHPVMYASRKCVDREKRYDIQNKEMLAIVWTCSKFYRFIYGTFFTIQTDCCALSMLNGRLSNNARVVRWQLYLQSFNFRVEVIRGEDNAPGDFVSRLGT